MCGIRNSGQRFKWSKIRSKILNYQKFANFTSFFYVSKRHC